MQARCPNCGSDAIQNRRLVIDSGTSQTRGSVDIKGSASVLGTSQRAYYTGSGTINATTQTDLAGRLQAARYAEIEAIVLPHLENFLLTHDLPGVAIRIEGQNFHAAKEFGQIIARGPSNRQQQIGLDARLKFASETVGKLKSAGERLRSDGVDFRAAAAKVRKPEGGYRSGFARLVHRARAWIETQILRAIQVNRAKAAMQDEIYRQIAEIDRNRCICMRCGFER